LPVRLRRTEAVVHPTAKVNGSEEPFIIRLDLHLKHGSRRALLGCAIFISREVRGEVPCAHINACVRRVRRRLYGRTGSVWFIRKDGDLEGNPSGTSPCPVSTHVAGTGRPMKGMEGAPRRASCGTFRIETRPRLQKPVRSRIPPALAGRRARGQKPLRSSEAIARA